ncbi:MAG: NUDIX pyrophosphatase [Chloroflexi bacterium RBG_13_46_14]|nr:MAG: NUDIX pyrophosphatase [Chloroflexi bacterium RBG_13_46_14]
MTDNLEEKHVVTCFLESGGRILLLRRSRQVGSYQGKWAGVSGYVESPPDKQAVIEINEETGLDTDDIELLKTGEALEIDDDEMGTRWIVHPFLFHVKTPEKVKIDWEHKEYKWIEPGDIDKYDTVPGLKNTLERVIHG